MGGHGDVILQVGVGDYQWMNRWPWRCDTTGGSGGLSVDEWVVMEMWYYRWEKGIISGWMVGHGDVILQMGEGDYQWMSRWSWVYDTTGGSGGLSVDEWVVMAMWYYRWEWGIISGWMGGHGDVILQVGVGDYQWMNGWSWRCDTRSGGGGLSMDEWVVMGMWYYRWGRGLSVDGWVVMEMLYYRWGRWIISGWVGGHGDVKGGGGLSVCDDVCSLLCLNTLTYATTRLSCNTLHQTPFIII